MPFDCLSFRRRRSAEANLTGKRVDIILAIKCVVFPCDMKGGSLEHTSGRMFAAVFQHIVGKGEGITAAGHLQQPFFSADKTASIDQNRINFSLKRRNPGHTVGSVIGKQAVLQCQALDTAEFIINRGGLHRKRCAFKRYIRIAVFAAKTVRYFLTLTSYAAILKGYSSNRFIRSQLDRHIVVIGSVKRETVKGDVVDVILIEHDFICIGAHGNDGNVLQASGFQSHP